MRGIAAACAALLAFAGAVPGQEDVPVEIAGKVVDAAGKPVAGADIAPYWVFHGDQSMPIEGAKSGEDGSFRISVQTSGQPWVLVAMDAERRRASFTNGGIAAPDEPVVLALAPSARVHGDFTCKALGGIPEWTNVYVYTENRTQRIAECQGTDARFSLVVPAGSWQLHLYGTDVKDLHLPLAAKPGGDADMGTLDFEPTVLARHYGKPLPPWTVTEARGTKKGVQLSDYRGKWVLLEFWGFW